MKIARVALVMLCSLGSAAANEVSDWNLVASNVMVAVPARTPLQQSRIYAMMHLAVHDALNAINSRYETYLPQADAPAGSSAAAAIAAASNDVLSATVPGQGAAITAQYVLSLSAIPDGPAKTSGVLAGQRAAAAMLSARASDGSEAIVPYTPLSAPGFWQPTAPAFAAAAAPGWGAVTPFGLREGSQFRPDEGPPAVTSRAYTADYNEVKAIGSIDSPSRTADQTEIGRFHFESTPIEWNRIGRGLVSTQGLGLWSSARMFAFINMTIADGFIAGFDTKYAYNYWRPITAIRAGDADTNLDTVGDASWTALLATPNHPDFPSTHSTASNAAAEALAHVFGTDNIAFVATSSTLPGVTRSFSSFSAAAEEISNSRIYAGIHFRTACREGLKLGGKVGKFDALHYLRPQPRARQAGLTRLDQ